MISLLFILYRFSNCKLDGVTSCVIDSEAVAWDREKKQIQPFQVLSTRKRKDAAESEIKVQVAVFAFDLLYLNGEALVRKPFEERRELLRKHFKEVEGEFVFAKFADPDSVEAIQEVLEQSVAGNFTVFWFFFRKTKTNYVLYTTTYYNSFSHMIYNIYQKII